MEAGAVVLGALAEHGGDVLGWIALRRADQLALGLMCSHCQLCIDCSQVADLVGVALGPSDRILVAAEDSDLPGRGLGLLG